MIESISFKNESIVLSASFAPPVAVISDWFLMRSLASRLEVSQRRKRRLALKRLLGILRWEVVHIGDCFDRIRQ